MAYMNVRVSRRLKEELGWAIDKRLRLIINKMLCKTVIPRAELEETEGFSCCTRAKEASSSQIEN